MNEQNDDKKINNVSKWDKVYQTKPLEEIPWGYETVPDWFKNIIENGWMSPCKVLDVGCGLGTYSDYLAEIGFDVLGVDFSQEAINKANANYKRDNLRFSVCDALKLDSLEEKFEGVIDISLFHHIKPEERLKYADSLASVTDTGSKVLVCCFNAKDELFEGKGEFYGPDTDTTTYVLTEEDIKETFKDTFNIIEISELAYGKLSKFKNSKTRKRHLVKMKRK
ncbi:MAG: methyltransferase type 12 [uncultured bacterium]|uniref:Methyltransferase type 12 n=1 Tax=Candidatus Wolfebacteria bacterium GW2011_GWC2_39_22 TaxID=1619013 RepID=A0A0G0NBX5_9BACT|nr:MAG: methyltransferase type 12 [uncultured bacterium]KKR13013.1 MAG: Methyltransferase type 12 [Candidatus Wolfebacteria bacterium GW2011_GWC2_39_22]HBC71601.1 hypothetical protein [Coxiellaceae bacterium]HBG34568.1 hypothetical protein [Holosporales bacterium]HBI25336.1 hypothetical protein [Candidatus Wolfebacteria bacterium]